MAESIKRKNSSKQLLQNLIRVTEQRSQEDAEEVERERRRRSREKQKGCLSCSVPPQPGVTHNTESDEELKPSCSALEEDEGFSDWSHRLEHRNEHELQEACRAKEHVPTAPSAAEENKQHKNEEEHEGSSFDEGSTQHPEKTSSTRSTDRTSPSSSVLVSQDSRLQPGAGQASDRTSHQAAESIKSHRGACRMDGELEQRMQDEEGKLKSPLLREPTEAPQSRGDEEDQEEEEELKEDFDITREESVRREDDATLNKRLTKGDRRSTEANSRSSGSLVSTSEGEESLNCYGPMSPTFKKLLIQFYPEEANSRVSTDGKCTIIERTESLRRSSNIKRTQAPVSVSKIDKRLEQYTHALEVSSKEEKLSCQPLTDLVSCSEPVAAKKNLFEAGEAWNQNVLSVTPSKDADSLKVGVADLINHWIKGGEDGSRSNSPSKPAETSTRPYKYVVAGHGKYTKASADNGCSEDVSGQAAGRCCEDL